MVAQKRAWAEPARIPDRPAGQPRSRRLAANEPGRRDLKARFPRSCGFAVLVTAAAIGLAACSGSANSPQVASLGDSSGAGSGSSTATGSSTTPKGDPAQLLDEWAACMRSHGDPDQSDPTITANKDISIYMSPSIQGGYEGYSGEYGSGGPGLYCRTYLTAAQTALNGGQPLPKYTFDEAKALKFSECMRANGIPDFPDPTSSGLSFNQGAGSDLNPSNPTFQIASKLCARKTGGGPHLGNGSQPGLILLDGGNVPGTTAGGAGANG